MKLQLHRVKLDGTGDMRLTDPVYNHSVDISPDGKYFIDVAQTHDIPPFTQLLDSKGQLVSKLAEKKIIVSARGEGIRISASIFNNENDVDILIAELTNILQI